MRQITKDIELTIDGSPVCFRLSKLDAFSGVALLRLLMRLDGQALPKSDIWMPAPEEARAADAVRA